jgi:hypothetical protein
MFIFVHIVVFLSAVSNLCLVSGLQVTVKSEFDLNGRLPGRLTGGAGAFSLVSVNKKWRVKEIKL